MTTIEKYIICPHCKAELDISKLITAQMMENFEEEKKAILQNALDHLEADYKEKLQKEIEEVRSERDNQTNTLMAQVEKLTKIIAEGDRERKSLVESQVDLQRKLQIAEFEAEKKAKEKIDEACDCIRKEVEESYSQRIGELEKKLADTKEMADNLRKKAEQGSQQLQGEVLELQLEEYLRMEFPLDDIREVEKGKPGADIIQRVINRSGKVCGTIVWELKNVKAWKNEFIPKLRADMQKEGGDTGILVSNMFGRNMEEFTLQDGVWLIRPANAMAMARLIRDGIIKAGIAKSIAENKGTIQEAVYEYITSPVFRNRIENIGQQYLALEKEISDTRRAMDRHWDKQRAMIESLVDNTQHILSDVDAHLLLSDSGESLLIDAPLESESEGC